MKQNEITSEISIKEILFILLRNRKILLISCIASMLLFTVYGRLITNKYTASSSILIQQEKTDITSVFSLGERNETNFLLNEVQILRSRNIAIKALDYLYENHRDNLILFGTNKPEYTFIGGTLRNIKNSIFKDKPLDLSSKEKFQNSPAYEVLVRSIRNNISVTNPRKTDIVVVNFTSQSPEESSLILNVIIDQYQKNDQEWAAGELIYLDNFLTDQIEEKEFDLKIAENELMKFQEKNNIVVGTEINTLLMTELTKIESDYFKTIAEKNIESERKAFYLNQLNKDEKLLTEKITNTLNIQLTSMRNALSKFETELVSTKATKGSDHPAVKELESRISKIKNDLEIDTRKYINDGISSSNPLAFRQAVMDTIISIGAKEQVLLSKEQELGNLVSQYDQRIKDLPSKILDYSRLKRSQTILDETYKVMKKTLEETRISKASELGRVRIIDYAIVPDSASSIPLTSYILFGLVLGFGIGASLIGLREYFDSTIKSIEEIERRGLPILSIIPEFDKSLISKERYIALLSDPKSVISEAYRNLRTSLSISNINENNTNKSILISSPGPKEGKSTTSCNLAVSYAQAGKKTIIIDCDLRKPVLHKIFNFKKRGITNFIEEHQTSKIEDFIKSSEVPNLDVLVAGPVPPNPSEILSSKLMNETLDKLKDIYDVIIIDSPPYIAVTDSYILMKHVDNIVMVIKSHVSDKAVLNRVLTSISQQNKSVDGVAFNSVKSGTGYYGGYYYNYYQYYYGESSEEG